MTVEPLIAFLPSVDLLIPKLLAKVLANEGNAYPAAGGRGDLPLRGVLLFLAWQEAFATRWGSNRLATLSGRG